MSDLGEADHKSENVKLNFSRSFKRLNLRFYGQIRLIMG